MSEDEPEKTINGVVTDEDYYPKDWPWHDYDPFEEEIEETDGIYLD